MLSSLVFASLVALVASHNWLNSPSRAGDGSRPQKASTVKPVPPAVGEAQVQINAGQDFQIEWVVGHNRHTYFSLISKADRGKLSMHNAKLLDDYFANAPNGQRGAPPKKYQKYHRKADMSRTWDAPSRKGVAQPQIANYFTRRVPANDPMHIPRDPIFKGSFRGARRHMIDPADVYQFEYPAEAHTTDRWAMYKSAKYPWILAAARYLHTKHQPTRPDVSLLKFPDDTPPGEYIVQYIWSGFTDAVDVNVITNRVTAPYGAKIPPNMPPPPAVFSRIDHCWYPGNTPAGRCRMLTGPNVDPKACIDDCKAKTQAECNGVVVVPIKAAEKVWKGFKDITVVPWGQNNCAKPANNAQATHVCFALKSREGTALDFEYWATTDPEDPAFYATCWHRRTPRAGFTPTESSFDPPDWEYRGSCISCADRKKYSTATVTPAWNLQSTCVNCDSTENGGSGSNNNNNNNNNNNSFDPATVRYFPFEEGSGKTTKELKNGGNVQLRGNAAWRSNAAVGKSALSLPGSANDHVRLGTFSVTGNKLTMAAWVNAENLGGNDPMIVGKYAGSYNSFIFALRSASPDAENKAPYYPRCYIKAGGSVRAITGNKPLKPNTWQHWACVYDGSRVRLYLDGVALNTASKTGSLNTSNAPVTIGAGARSTNTGGNYGSAFKGGLDDVRIIKKALSANEIKALFNMKK